MTNLLATKPLMTALAATVGGPESALKNILGNIPGNLLELGDLLEIQGWQDVWLWILAVLFASCVANADFHRRFQQSIRSAPRLEALTDFPAALPSISVIIPAYNEAVNIAECMASVLSNELPEGAQMTLIVADDESSDQTRAIADAIAADDARVSVFTVPPRPTDNPDRPWRGKNWACVQAAEHASGEYLLFIDADVRLEAAAIACALVNAQTHAADLLSCAPKITYGCFAEWLVQPIMALLIAVGFSFEGVNDPAQVHKSAAAGPFMLFRRAAYDKIGGHSAVAAEAVEDFALASLIKTKGLKLRYVLGLEMVSVRMYRSFAGLWEGWTKNFHIAGGRNVALSVLSAGAIALLFVVPWLGLVVGAVGMAMGVIAGQAALGLTVLALAIHLYMRLRAAAVIGQQRYLWLGWLGGAIVSAIAIVSMIKTETGWRWTWKGRSLAAPS